MDGMAPLRNFIDVATHPAAAALDQSSNARVKDALPRISLHFGASTGRSIIPNSTPALSFGSYLAFCVLFQQDCSKVLLRAVSFYEALIQSNISA